MANETAFVELLEEELKTPIKSAKQAYRIVYLLGIGMIYVYRDQAQIAKEIHGNGVPGGIKLQVASLITSQSGTDRNIKELSDLMKKEWKASAEAAPPLPIQPKDTFREFIVWFRDRVLPTLVIGAILGIGQVLLFSWLMQNGYIK